MQSGLAAEPQRIQVGLGSSSSPPSLQDVLFADQPSKQTHQRLRNLGKAKKDGDSASTHASECSICLMSIAVSPRVTPCFGILMQIAMSISVRRPVFACMALQMHPPHTQRPNLAKFPVPQLPSRG